MKTEVDFDKLLDSLADKLPVLDITKQVKESYITGHELILCGHKMWNGKFIQPDKMYTILVPIAQGKLIDKNAPASNENVEYKRIDHKSKLKTHWRMNGLTGIYHYLRPYLTDAQMQWVKNHFMSPSIA